MLWIRRSINLSYFTHLTKHKVPYIHVFAYLCHCVCILLKQLKAHYQTLWHHIMSYKICNIVLYNTLHQILKIPRIGIFSDLLECDNLTLTPIFKKKFKNTLFEWILDLTSMTEHIYDIIHWNMLKCQRRFFFHHTFNQQSWFDWLIMGFSVH
jgi:hypothetical protein